jgi:hypothetical protein
MINTQAMIDAAIVEAEERVAVLIKDRESLAAMLACLIEDRGGPAFISSARFNEALRNRTIVMEESEDPAGIALRVSR